MSTESSVQIRGIAIHPASTAYIRDTYSIELVETISGIPIYCGRDGRLLVGAAKHLYTVAIGDTSALLDTLAAYREEKPFVRYGFSTEKDFFHTKRLHFMLHVSHDTDDVRILYTSKKRNQVRKSEKLIDDIRIEARPNAFHVLYSRSMERLGSTPRTENWFDTLEKYFGGDVYTASAYYGGKLIASNYYIRSGDYALLLFNVSDERFWHLDANNRVYDSYIRHVIGLGVRYIDFGPSMASDTSHAHFKLGFGARPHYLADKLYATTQERLYEIWRTHTPRLRRMLGLQR